MTQDKTTKRVEFSQFCQQHKHDNSVDQLGAKNSHF